MQIFQLPPDEVDIKVVFLGFLATIVVGLVVMLLAMFCLGTVLVPGHPFNKAESQLVLPLHAAPARPSSTKAS